VHVRVDVTLLSTLKGNTVDLYNVGYLATDLAAKPLLITPEANERTQGP
jgi:hypothetical protein